MPSDATHRRIRRLMDAALRRCDLEEAHRCRKCGEVLHPQQEGDLCGTCIINAFPPYKEKE